MRPQRDRHEQRATVLDRCARRDDLELNANELPVNVMNDDERCDDVMAMALMRQPTMHPT